jgi:predicted lipoprotein with Yx(FWY)xxD motif
MIKVKRALLLAAALTMVAAGCGSDDDDTTDTTAAVDAADDAATDDTTTESTEATDDAATDETTESTEAAEEEADAAPAEAGDLALATTDLGDILVDVDGNTVYLYTPDEQGESTCYDACEEAWPVVGEVTVVGDGLDESLLGTTTRTDGVVQATYNSWPLYYFANDTAPGDTAGQGVSDVWYVVDATGAAISS